MGYNLYIIIFSIISKIAYNSFRSYYQYFLHRLRNIEVRAGTSKEVFSNPILGRFEGPGEDGSEHMIPFPNPTTVEYITIQLKHKDRQYLQINGIKINEATESKY